jgi:tripartite-type tricarboxylate transporter receptor subunit TctC
MKIHVLRAIGGAVAVMAGAVVVPASAQAADPFFKDKRIEFIIGQASGGTYDQWARVISRHMGRHIPGNPGFLPKNMPGAGHIKATNYLFNVAPKDGTTIGIFSRNIPTQALLKHPAVQFKTETFNWLGSPELTNRVCVAKKGAPVQTGEDLFSKELVVGGAGSGSAPSTTPKVLKGALGMKFKLIEGYDGPPAVLLAVERGEVHGICQTVAGLDQIQPGWFEKGGFRVLFSLEKKPVARFGAPTIYTFVKTEEQRQIVSFFSSSTELGRPIAAPPGVPADRVNALRRAFDAVMTDPKFMAEAKKQGLKINALTGEELADRVADLARTPQDIVARTEDIAGLKKKKKKKKKN